MTHFAMSFSSYLKGDCCMRFCFGVIRVYGCIPFTDIFIEQFPPPPLLLCRCRPLWLEALERERSLYSDDCQGFLATRNDRLCVQ